MKKLKYCLKHARGGVAGFQLYRMGWRMAYGVLEF
jgi:hypothetical protein